MVLRETTVTTCMIGLAAGAALLGTSGCSTDSKLTAIYVAPVLPDAIAATNTGDAEDGRLRVEARVPDGREFAGYHWEYVNPRRFAVRSPCGLIRAAPLAGGDHIDRVGFLWGQGNMVCAFSVDGETGEDVIRCADDSGAKWRAARVRGTRHLTLHLDLEATGNICARR